MVLFAGIFVISYCLFVILLLYLQKKGTMIILFGFKTLVEWTLGIFFGVSFIVLWIGIIYAGIQYMRHCNGDTTGLNSDDDISGIYGCHDWGGWDGGDGADS